MKRNNNSIENNRNDNNNIICKFYKTSSCKNGNNCKFLHVRSLVSSTQPLVSNVKKVHSNKSLISFHCIKCGQKNEDDDANFICCENYKMKKVRGITMDRIPNMTKHVLSLKDSWKICENNVIPNNYQDLLTYTDACEEIEKDILKLLSSVNREQLRKAESWDFVCRPWSISASCLKSKSDLMDCFFDKAEFIGRSNVLDEASLGDCIDSLLYDACDNDSSILGSKWSQAENMTGVLAPFNVNVQGTPDACYDEGSIPIELKTLRRLDQRLLSQKLDGYLPQIAVYQHLFELNGRSDIAFLILVSRDDHQIKVLQVNSNNKFRALDKWTRLIDENEILRDCLEIARPYCEEIVLSDNPSTTSFLDICSSSYDLFARHAFQFIDQCHQSLIDQDYDQVASYYSSANQCYKRLQSRDCRHGEKGNIKQKILELKKDILSLATRFFFEGLQGNGFARLKISQSLFTVCKSSNDRVTEIVRSCKKKYKSEIGIEISAENFDEINTIIDDMANFEKQNNMKCFKEYENLAYEIISRIASEYKSIADSIQVITD